MQEVEIITTTVSPRHRTISLLLNNGQTARFALVRKPGGDVYWSYDLFTRDRPAEPVRWLAHMGRLTVGDLVGRLPGCEREIVRWTQEELDDGPDLAGLDIFARDARRRSLDRLAAELAAVPRAA